MVRRLRLRVHGHFAHARGQIFRHEHKIATVGMLRPAVLVLSDGMCVRLFRMRDLPGVHEARRGRAECRGHALMLRRVRLEVEITGQDGR